MKKLLLLTLTITASLASEFSHAQGLGLNTDGAVADTSALLDVKSTSKGMLVPRMSQAERNLIQGPATSLLVYQTDNTPGFYYNSGTPGAPAWTPISGGANVTTQGNSFNGNNQLVQLNASGQLPAISGAGLTNLNADNISSGTLNASRLPSSTTAQGNTFNGNNQLVQLNASGQLPALSGANLTGLPASNLTGSLPAISGANLTGLNADNIVSGTLNALRLPTNATTQGNTFNGSSQLVQLNASGQLPALNGANLTGLSAGNLAGSLPAISGANLTGLNADNIGSGTLSALRLPPTATTQGNLFNGASQLVQLNAAGQLPTLNGNNLVSLNADNIAFGTLSALRLPSTATTQGNSFNGANQLVQLNGSGQLPALNGSNLTSLSAGNLTGTLPAISGANLTSLPAGNLTGTLPAISGANLTSLPTTATVQGNTFNGANQLVKLNGSGQLPALSAANLTSLPAGNLTGALPAISGASLTNMPTDGMLFLQTTNSSSATYWYGLPVGTSNTTSSANAAFICPKTITFNAMYVSVTETAGQPSGFTYSYTLLVNGAATGMTCNVTMVPGTTVTSSSTTPVTVTAGQTISFVTSTSQSGTTPLATIRTSLAY